MTRLALGTCFLLSAALSFAVQPLIGKLILPWYGGAPTVWSTLLLFFQVMLLAGYLYSHAVASRLEPRAQVVLHGLVIAGALALVAAAWWRWDTPLTPDASWQPRVDQHPVPQILALLVVTIGAPYFVLATTTPLLQSWSVHLPGGGASPYRYFALANLGSLVALLAYPLLIEAYVPLGWQARGWAIGFVLVAAGIGYVALRVRRPQGRIVGAEPAGRAASGDEARAATAHGPTRIALWIALPACGTMLLLAVTNQLTQDVAVIPLLWIAPLLLYLLSLIICFGRPRWYSRWLVAGLLLAVALHGALLFGRNDLHFLAQLGGYSVLLLAACMVCHGELVRLRPAPARLTGYYLAIAFGGALGGAFVALVAPAIFDDYHELPLGLTLTWGLAFAAWIVDRRSPLHGPRSGLLTMLTALALAALGLVTMLNVRSTDNALLESRRGFFGVIWVAASRPAGGAPALTQLGHGVTVHGSQLADERFRRRPTTYYGRRSGVGVAHAHLARTGRDRRVGVVGLGVGTLATYGRRGDRYVFYEINPDVIELARGAGGHFSYLADSPASIEVVSGDARLSLQRELEGRGSRAFDLLVLDAFSSHAIPVHLLTAECFALYLAHLTPGGVLAVHIGNPHLELAPIVEQLGAHHDLAAAVIGSRGDGRVEYDAEWVLLSADRRFFKSPEIAGATQLTSRRPAATRLWTDDFSNPLAAVR